MNENNADSFSTDSVQELATAIVVDVGADTCRHHKDVQWNRPDRDVSQTEAWSGQSGLGLRVYCLGIGLIS